MAWLGNGVSFFFPHLSSATCNTCISLKKTRTALSIQPRDTPSKRFSQGWKWRGNDSDGVAGLWFWLCGGVGFHALTIEQPLAAFLRLGLAFLFQPAHRPLFSIRDITVSLINYQIITWVSHLHTSLYRRETQPHSRPPLLSSQTLQPKFRIPSRKPCGLQSTSTVFHATSTKQA